MNDETGLASLDTFQSYLHSIYDVAVPYTVSDFVTTDQALMSLLCDGDKDHLKEKLLILQDGEDIDLSLYLHSDVIDSLRKHPIEYHLTADNLQNLCFAIEGISHFLYLIWRALRQHRVSLLELELQAEVDKFILLLAMIRRQRKHDLVGRLHYLLFEAVHFDDALTETEAMRYREANHYAGKYCHRLQERYRQDFGSDEMVSELRGFYRLNQAEKVQRISNRPV